MLNSKTAEDLLKALDSGEIQRTGKLPELFQENERIIDPAGDHGQKFQHIMEGLTKKLWPDWDFSADPITFLVKDDEVSLDAYVIPGKKPNLMVFSKMMLEFCKDEDELVYILGHELNHILIKKEMGTDYITESEEAMADLKHIPRMIQAGYNPFAGRDVAARFHDHQEGLLEGDAPIIDPNRDMRVLNKVLIALVDEHASPALRAAYINNFISGEAKLEGGEGGFESRPRTPINPELTDIWQDSLHTGYFDQLDEATESGKPFDQLNVDEKLEFIARHVLDVKDGFEHRPKQLASWLEHTDSDPTNPKHRAIGTAMLADLMQRPDAFNTSYGLVLMNLLNEPPKKPLGELAGLADSMNKIVGATTKEDFKAAAKDMVDYIEKHPAFNYKLIKWPSFTIPDKETIMQYNPLYHHGHPLPWNKQVAWAIEEMQQTGDFTMGKSLLLMGAEDKRLYDPCPTPLFKEVLEGQRFGGKYGITLPSGPRLDHMLVDFDKGNITNVVVGNPMGLMAEPWSPSKYLEIIQPRKYFAQDIAHLQTPIADLSSISNQDFMANFKDWAEQNKDQLNLPEAYTIDITVQGRGGFGEKENITRDTLIAINEALALDKDPKTELKGRKKQVLDLLYTPYAQNAQKLMQKFDQLLQTGGEEEKQFVRRFFLDTESQETASYTLCKHKDLWHQGVKPGTVVPLPVDFPYNEFVSKNAHKLFSLQEQAAILNTNCMIPNAHDKWWQETIGYEAPKTRRDLLNILKKYESFLEAKVPSFTDAVNAQITKVAELYFNYNRADKGYEPTDLPDLFASCPKIIHRISNENIYVEKMGSGSWKPFSSIFNAEVKAVRNWPYDAVELAKVYKTMEIDNLFPNVKWQKEFGERIIQSLDTEQFTDRKITALETLLCGTTLKNIPLRQYALQEWAKAILKQQDTLDLGIDGKDDSSQAYRDSLVPLVARVKKTAGASTGHEMLAELANVLETQRDVSYLFRDTYSLNKSTLENADLPIRMGEALMVLFAESEKDRKSCIDFLTSPADDKALKKMGTQMRNAIEKLHDNPGALTVVQDRARSLFHPNRDKEYYKITAKDLHENYWNLPLPARAAIMDELLVPSDERYYGDKTKAASNTLVQQKLNVSDKAYKDAYDLVVEKLMPTDMNYGKEAREFMEIYRSVIPESQRNLFLAVMLSVEKAVQDMGTDQVSIGRRLSMVLDMMGPAERKLGQAIHSHPMTPDDIRDDMGMLKFKASPGTRWEAWEDYDRTVHPEYQKEIKRLGKFLGSASYFKSFEVERTDGSNGVIQFQRPHVLAQAHEGFRLLEDFVTSLRGKDSANEEVCDIMGDMLSQAKKMSGTETSSDIGVKQVEAAQRLYNGVKVKVGEHTFSVATAQWRAYGPEFRDQEKMPGVHFNELAEDTPDALNYKKAVAKAYLTVEFRNLLSGKAFDHDRHGAQLRVDTKTNQLGLFDHGAFHAEVYKKDNTLAKPWEPETVVSDDYAKVLSEGGTIKIPDPSPQEQRLLADTLFTALTRYLEHKTPLAQTLYDEIKIMKKEQGVIPEHLVRVQRSLLALNDFIGLNTGKKQAAGQATPAADTTIKQTARYVNEQDMVDILQGLFNDKQREHIAPDIKQNLEDKLAPFKRRQAVKYIGSMFKRIVGGAAPTLPSFDAQESVELSQDTVKAPLPPARYEAPPKQDAQISLQTGASQPQRTSPKTDPAASIIEKKSRPGPTQRRTTQKTFQDFASERDGQKLE